jgi:hypothetical protein
MELSKEYRENLKSASETIAKIDLSARYHLSDCEGVGKSLMTLGIMKKALTTADGLIDADDLTTMLTSLPNVISEISTAANKNGVNSYALTTALQGFNTQLSQLANSANDCIEADRMTRLHSTPRTIEI